MSTEDQIETKIRDRHLAEQRLITETVLGAVATVPVQEVTTKVYFELPEPVEWPGENQTGTFDRVTVAVTRFPNGHPDGEGAYWEARAHFIPKDKRSSAWWPHLPAAVAKALIHKAVEA